MEASCNENRLIIKESTLETFKILQEFILVLISKFKYLSTILTQVKSIKKEPIRDLNIIKIDKVVLLKGLG